jgi:hypothetical protein
LAGDLIDALAIVFIGGADFNSSNSPSTSSLVMARPVSPFSRTALFKNDRIQPAAASPPARWWRQIPRRSLNPIADVVKQFGREGPGAHAGGVGLDDADDAIDIFRADAAAAAGIARGRIGGGDKGVGAVIDVQMGALGAFEQDLLSGFAGFLQPWKRW